MKVHEVIATVLRDLGVGTMFGLMGDGNLFFCDQFIRHHGGQFIASASEAGAVMMASGYASVSGELGVATVTHGPALTNCLTPLIDAVRSRTPLLLIAGDTPVIDRHNLQDIDQREMIQATGAGFVQVRAPETLPQDMARAVNMAFVERRPVCLNVPIEFQWQEVDHRPMSYRRMLPQAMSADPAAVEEALGFIASARRPIVLAGRGATSRDTREALLALADRIGAPVATTLRAKDLFRGEPHNVGFFGSMSSSSGLEVISRSDCVLVFGASLNQYTSDGGSLLKGKSVIHCDSDPRSLVEWTDRTVSVLGDSAAVAREIFRWLDKADIPVTRFRTRAMEEALAIGHAGEGRHLTGPGIVDLRDALQVVQETVPAGRTLVADLGRFMRPAMKVLSVEDPRSYVHTASFGSIGLGVGHAVGAAAAAPDRPCLVVTGDGGFMLGGLAEFNTAVRNLLDVIVLVLNDCAYGAEHIQFRNRGMDPSSSQMQWPDLADVAKALGGSGVTINSAEALLALPKHISERQGPLLINVRIDPNWQ